MNSLLYKDRFTPNQQQQASSVSVRKRKTFFSHIKTMFRVKRVHHAFIFSILVNFQFESHRKLSRKMQ